MKTFVRYSQAVLACEQHGEGYAVYKLDILFAVELFDPQRPCIYQSMSKPPDKDLHYNYGYWNHRVYSNMPRQALASEINGKGRVHLHARQRT